MTATMAGSHSARQRRLNWVWRAVALVFVAIILFPVYWMVNSSFEPQGQILSLTPSFFPVHFTFHNLWTPPGDRFSWSTCATA